MNTTKIYQTVQPPQKEWLETSNNMEGFGSWCFWTKFSGWCSSSGAFFFQWEHFSSDLWAKWLPHIHHRQSSHPRMLPAGHHTFSVDLFRFENGGFPSRWKLVHTQGYPATGTPKILLKKVLYKGTLAGTPGSIAETLRGSTIVYDILQYHVTFLCTFFLE